MCGLAGFFTDEPLEAHADRCLGRMLTRLAHRGPDGPGQHIDRRANVAMGHVRLAINDLTASGAQPLVSEDGQLALTVAGEIYEFRRLRARLTAEGERFASKSDSELVLALYRRHGLAFVDQLRGEFAIALFDRERQRLVLVRDRFGVRPLFYHATPRLVAWASEAKALLAHPAVPRRLSRQAAVNQLVQVMVPGTSAFDGICALQPGHMLVVERTTRGLELSHRKYWDLSYPTIGEPDPGADAHVAAVRDAVVDALAVRTEADVPIGFYLSGGMDSGALLGLAAALLQDRPRAFTLGFEDPAYDEAEIAQRVAAVAGVQTNLRLITDADLYGDHYVRAVEHSERTFYNTLGIAKMHLSAATRGAGIRAVISGEGADEMFAGYPAFAMDHAAAGPRAASADPLFVGAIVPARPEQHAAFDRVCGFTPAWVQPWVSTWRGVRPLLDDGLLAELADYDPLTAVAHSLDPSMMEGRHRLDVAQYSWIKIMLDGQILNWGGDRVDMANAVESRPVFLDHQLAAVAARVPPEYRIRDGKEKWVLREALRFAMPPFLYERRKFAFMAPPAHRSSGRAAAVRALADRYLAERSIERVGICDPRRTRRFVESMTETTDLATANEHDKICNHLLGLHILHDLFVA